MASHQPRILILTAGHLATCPRMVKVADALCAQYDVRVVSTNFMPWAAAVDRDLRRTRTWRWTPIECSRAGAGRDYWRRTIAFHVGRRMVRVMGPDQVSLSTATDAHARFHRDLINAALSEPFDFVYAGTSGALAAAADVARQRDVDYALDLEDFHSAEHSGVDAALDDGLARRVESAVLGPAKFLTTSSREIAEAYEMAYGQRPAVVHNTFPLPSVRRRPSEEGPLRIYWFSQTLGTDRGLEDVIRAAGQVKAAMSLHLRARAEAGPRESLEQLARSVAPNLSLVFLEPAPADQMIELCAEHHVGVATERHEPLNRDLSLTNKIFTYLSAGIPALVTATRAQQRLAREVGESAFVYEPGDVAALAGYLRTLTGDRARWRAASDAAWAAASNRWRWDHPEECGRVRELVAGALEARSLRATPVFATV